MASTPSINEILDEAAAAIKRGDIAQGEQMLQQLLQSDPRNVLALLWMTKCYEDPYEKVALFQLVLSLDQANPHALKGLHLYRKYVKPPRHPIPSPPSSEPIASAADFQPAPPSSLPIAGKLLIPAILVVSVILLLALAIVFLPIHRGPSEEFRANLTDFILAAARLDALTDQGVTNIDYRSQLAEVRSRFSILETQWPQELLAEKLMFDRAVYGWGLTLRVWDYGLDFTYLNLAYLQDDDPMASEVATLLDIDLQTVHINSVGNFMPFLLSASSDAFHSARNAIEAALNG